MSISVGNANNSYAAYQTQTTKKSLQPREILQETTDEDYLNELQKKNPQINITVGKADKSQNTSNSTGRTDVIIAPEFLDKMTKDPELAAKYEKILSDIPVLNKWADSMIKAMTGSEVKYRAVWIDENGNMGSMCVTGPGEAQKKAHEAEKAEGKEQQEKIIAKRKEKKEEIDKLYEEYLNGKRNCLPIIENYINKTSKHTMLDKRI